mmetsp:Transcript_21339/g.52242  ORF Transcript_21339/g.52242 Transcript_21339/m.52242 type:complete len:271 (-) Transcript_21339:242-1054(-)|eukprot:CAMPEP_0114511808 /NCGR_PEP_ID=MMETSP0109-20121206/14615_1 /TAXON_ID=29199 /ORGANISM="Chlorarachnion reptans, Strain CCCM449" /LENGTH=270 /DNA_ID=CAMNT_0001691401 /DNA_START=73 /DNA_END=885 /DNA_ORIENTATION=+
MGFETPHRIAVIALCTVLCYSSPSRVSKRAIGHTPVALRIRRKFLNTETESGRLHSRLNVIADRVVDFADKKITTRDSEARSSQIAQSSGDEVVLKPGEAIKGLYAAFNARNASAASEFLTDDCLYEDLLLGPATICRGKRAFENALSFHPAFVMDKIGKVMPFLKPPELKLIVDSVAEGKDAVGVEWHVEVDRKPFPMGRGLTQARLCPKSGKINHVVDIAEAPWRVIGLIAAPLLNFLFRPYVAMNYPSSQLKGESSASGSEIRESRR